MCVLPSLLIAYLLSCLLTANPLLVVFEASCVRLFGLAFFGVYKKGGWGLEEKLMVYCMGRRSGTHGRKLDDELGTFFAFCVGCIIVVVFFRFRAGIGCDGVGGRGREGGRDEWRWRWMDRENIFKICYLLLSAAASYLYYCLLRFFRFRCCF